MIVPTLRVGMPQGMLRVPALEWEAERHGLHPLLRVGTISGPVGARLAREGRDSVSGQSIEP